MSTALEYPALEVLQAKQAALENFWHPSTIIQNSPLLAKYAPGLVQSNSDASLQAALAAHKAKRQADFLAGNQNPSTTLRAAGFRRAPGMGG